MPALHSAATRKNATPKSVEGLDACFIVSDNAGQKPAHAYFEEKPGRIGASLGL